jgi:hypothetical protein
MFRRLMTAIRAWAKPLTIDDMLLIRVGDTRVAC